MQGLQVFVLALPLSLERGLHCLSLSFLLSKRAQYYLPQAAGAGRLNNIIYTKFRTGPSMW